MSNFKVNRYPHGTFSWADLSATDQAAARTFYTRLMGWEATEMPIDEHQTYTMLTLEGETVAALSQMPPDMQAQGMPSFWTNYITVDDVDAMPARIKELGGTVMMEPMDVFDQGRMLMMQDPTGATVALWQAGKHIGAGLVNRPGAMSWNELATRDSDAAQRFYSQLLGWEFGVDEQSGYRYITNQGRPNGGIIQMNEEWGDIPPHWMTYFTVEDLDASVKQVEALGGRISVEPTALNSGDRFAVIADPTGGVVTLFQSSNPQPWED